MIDFLAALHDAVTEATERERMVTVVFAVCVAAFILAAYIGLRRRNADDDSKINFDDLLLDPITQKIDPARCVLLAGFIIDALVLLYAVARAAPVPEGLSTMYLIFNTAVTAPAVAVVLKTKVVMQKQPSEEEGK